MKCKTCNTLLSIFDSVCPNCGTTIDRKIQNIEEIQHKVKYIIEKKCPNCGAPLTSNHCEFCGSEFVESIDEQPNDLYGYDDCGGTCVGTCNGVCTACTGTCVGSCSSQSACSE